MEKLEYITEDENCNLFKKNKENITHYVKEGRMRVVKVPNPTIDPSSVIDYVPRSLIPELANAFVVSDFSPDAQAIVYGKFYSFYAVQFYHLY